MTSRMLTFLTYSPIQKLLPIQERILRNV